MPTGMYARIDTINFDLSSFSKALAEDCRKMIRLAAQKWLMAVIRRIPVRTGFLAGAFTPLENLVGSVNKQTGRINMSRNPLLTREKKIDSLTKKLRAMQASIERSTERLRHIEGRAEESLREQRRSRAEQLKEMHRTMRIEDQIKRVERQIQKLLGRRARTPGGVGQLEVMRALEKLRRKRIELGYFKKRGPYNPTLFRSSAKFKKIEKEIYATRQVVTGKEYTQKERQDAIRKRIKLEKQKIEVIKELIGKEKTTGIKKYGKRVRAFGEYYYYPGGKVLKTPRSGVQFATPEKDIFGEFTESENAQAREVVSSFQRQIEATQRLLSQAGFTERLERMNEDTGLSENTINKMQQKAMNQLRDAKVFFTFKFEVAIIYWSVNDLATRQLRPTSNSIYNTSRQQSIPWNSLQAGNAAFAAYIRSAMGANASGFKSLGHLEDFLLKRTINFDGSSASANEVRRVMRS